MRSIENMMNITPSISLTFFLTADEFDLDEVTRKMEITPTGTRTKDSFPQQSIDAGFACTGWVLEIEEEHCLAVSILFDRLLEVLRGKEKTIERLQNDYGIEASISISIYMHDIAARPEIWLPQEVVQFAASINASIGFDLYSNCSCEDDETIIMTDDGYYKISENEEYS